MSSVFSLVILSSFTQPSNTIGEPSALYLAINCAMSSALFNNWALCKGGSCAKPGIWSCDPQCKTLSTDWPLHQVHLLHMVPLACPHPSPCLLSPSPYLASNPRCWCLVNWSTWAVKTYSIHNTSLGEHCSIRWGSALGSDHVFLDHIMHPHTPNPLV